jgi:hypothetical protein
MAHPGRENPSLDALTTRLAETPQVCWGEPVIRGAGELRVDAVVHDLHVLHGLDSPSLDALRFFRGGNASARNHLRIAAITAWLLADPWFAGQPDLSDRILEILEAGIEPLAGLVDAEQFILDSDRREELVRLTLGRFGVTPDDESPEHAADRLKALDSVERARLVREAAEARARQRKLEEEMRRKAAAEAASRYNRE